MITTQVVVGGGVVMYSSFPCIIHSLQHPARTCAAAGSRRQLMLLGHVWSPACHHSQHHLGVVLWLIQQSVQWRLVVRCVCVCVCVCACLAGHEQKQRRVAGKLYLLLGKVMEWQLPRQHLIHDDRKTVHVRCCAEAVVCHQLLRVGRGRRA